MSIPLAYAKELRLVVVALAFIDLAMVAAANSAMTKVFMVYVYYYLPLN
jgi:hypothetical protein